MAVWPSLYLAVDLTFILYSQLEGSLVQFSGMLQNTLHTEMVAKDVAGVRQAIGT